MHPWQNLQISFERKSDIKPNWAGLPHETVEEYLARGGTITICPPFENYLFRLFDSIYEDDHIIEKMII